MICSVIVASLCEIIMTWGVRLLLNSSSFPLLAFPSPFSPLSFSFLCAVKIYCESVHKFWSLKCEFVQMIHMVRIWKWIILTSVAFSSSRKFSINLTWHPVVKSSHLSTNVMTDRHTDSQSQVKNIVPFIKGITL